MKQSESENDSIVETNAGFSSILTRLCHFNDSLKPFNNQPIERFVNNLGTERSNDTAALLKHFLWNENSDQTYNSFIDSFDSPSPSVLSYYDDDFNGKCYVSHVVDEAKSICFIIDGTRMPSTSLFYGRSLRPLGRIPKVGEVFAYKYHRRFMMRVMRIDDYYSSSDNTYHAKFIDIGCNIWIDATDMQNHFELDESIKEIPACAIKCHVLRMPTNQNLLNVLHNKMKFRIIRIDNLLMHIELKACVSTQPKGVRVEGDRQFYSYFEYESNTLRENRFDSLPSVHNANNFKSNLDGGQKMLNCSEMDLSCRENENVQTKNVLSMSFDSNDGGWNAHKDRMTKFVDSLVPDELEVESPDVEELQLRAITKWPSAGQSITIQVVSVHDFERIYVYCSSCYPPNMISSEDLRLAMNEPQNMRDLVPYSEIPAVNELVIATYQDEVYRARVILHYDVDHVQVLFIDYGNCSKVNVREGQLYKWIPRWNYVPPQAIKCRINSIKTMGAYDLRALSELENIILNRLLNVEAAEVEESDGETTLVVNFCKQTDAEIIVLLEKDNLINETYSTNR